MTVPGYSAVKSYVAVDAENPPTNAFDESKTYQLESSPERGSYDESKCETDLRRENASEPLSPGQVAVIQRLQYQVEIYFGLYYLTTTMLNAHYSICLSVAGTSIEGANRSCSTNATTA